MREEREGMDDCCQKHRKKETSLCNWAGLKSQFCPLQANDLEHITLLSESQFPDLENEAHHTCPARAGKHQHRGRHHLDFEKWRLSVFIIIRWMIDSFIDF